MEERLQQTPTPQLSGAMAEAFQKVSDEFQKISEVPGLGRATPAASDSAALTSMAPPMTKATTSRPLRPPTPKLQLSPRPPPPPGVPMVDPTADCLFGRGGVAVSTGDETPPPGSIPEIAPQGASDVFRRFSGAACPAGSSGFPGVLDRGVCHTTARPSGSSNQPGVSDGGASFEALFPAPRDNSQAGSFRPDLEFKAPPCQRVWKAPPHNLPPLI